MRRFFLVGYMGCGKTTLGKILSKQLGLTFIDLDIFIENRYLKSINDIFREKGEQRFRQIEQNVLQEVSEFEDVMIATGGGTPCFFNNMELMNQKGTTIYLQTNLDTLFNRLKAGKTARPIIRDKTDDQLKLFIESSLVQRSPFYEKAKLTFDANKLETHEEIIQTSERLNNLLVTF